MTFLAHASQAYVVTKLVTQSEEIAIANALIATMPDTLSFIDTRKDMWGFYLRLHDVSNWIMLLLFPAAWLHAATDFVYHDSLGKWYRWVYFAEAGWWAFFIYHLIGRLT